MRELKEKYQFHASLDSQREKLQHLEGEVKWAEIMELEDVRLTVGILLEYIIVCMDVLETRISSEEA